MLELNTSIINVLFSNKYYNNHINRFLGEISKTLHINLNEHNSENVLEKLEQVLAYFNAIFLRELIAQIDKIKK